MKYLKFILVAVVMMATNSLSAQSLLWGVDFSTQFDNREFGVSQIAKSQTIFGARLTPQIGVGWENHKLMVGTNAIVEFGAAPFDVNPDLLLYYNYDTEKYKAFVGAFPRNKMVGQYSTAFFNDSIRFYDNQLEGFMLQYTAPRGYFEIGLDWNSRIDDEVREKFMIFSAGKMCRGIGYAGYDFTMYHHAGTAKIDGVVDNILFNPYVGLDFSRKKMWLDSLTVQVGYLQALQNDRRYIGEFTRPGGVQINFTVEKYGVGIYNSLYLGDGLMPYYDIYGTGLYSGDSFYRTSADTYDRLELYWEPFRNRTVNLKVSSVHHYDGCRWGWQQLLTFSATINQNTFRKKPKSE